MIDNNRIIQEGVFYEKALKQKNEHSKYRNFDNWTRKYGTKVALGAICIGSGLAFVKNCTNLFNNK